MAELCNGRRPDRAGAPSTAVPAEAAISRQPAPRLGPGDLPGGPDYVDDWMNKNLAPGLVDFVRSCCTSFVRWDLLRHLHSDPVAMTPKELARAIGANQVTAARELEGLASMGLVSRRRRGGRITYQLDAGSVLGRALDAALTAYEDDREFRFALVYSIVRASHQDAVLD